MVKSYKELLAYQKSYGLVLSIYELTQVFPGEERYGLTSQMRRSAVSIPSNIAEGWMRGSKEYAQFLRIALGSAAELETQLSISRDLGYCNPERHDALQAPLEETMKLLRTYIGKIANSG